MRLSNIRIALKGKPLLHVDADIGAGEVLCLMGPSGCGKSTLLHYMTGHLPAMFTASGQVLIGGQDMTQLAPHTRRMGLLFQDDLLFPHMSVAQNLLFGLNGRRDRMARVEQALVSVGLAGFGPRDPATLSGGQRARVALMRTLLSEPRALLLDEPFSRLDVALRDQVRRLVFDHARERGLPVLLVTHDPADAEAAGGKVITLPTPAF